MCMRTFRGAMGVLRAFSSFGFKLGEIARVSLHAAESIVGVRQKACRPIYTFVPSEIITNSYARQNMGKNMWWN